MDTLRDEQGIEVVGGFTPSTLGFAPAPKKRNRPQYQFDTTLDWEALGLLEDFTETELTAIAVVRDYLEEHKKLPPSENFHSIMLAGSKKLGAAVPLTREIVDNEIFKDLFPFNSEIRASDALRRLIGFGVSELSVDEIAECIRYASQLLTLQKNSPKPIAPTTGDIKRAIAAKIIVPGVACPMPSPETMVRKLDGDTWKETVSQVLGMSEGEIRKQLNTTVTLDEIIADYKAAFAYYHGDVQPDDERIVTYDELDFFAKAEDGLGSRRYQNYISKAIDAGIYININDIRRYAKLPVNEVSDNRRVRRAQTKWTAEEVVEGYLAAWEHYGRQNDPPTHEQLNDLSLLQTDAINKFGVIDEAPSRDRNIPQTRVPAQKMIESQFISLTHLLGHLERKLDIDISIDDKWRVGLMAGDSLRKGRDPLMLPTCVVQRMTEMEPPTANSSGNLALGD